MQKQGSSNALGWHFFDLKNRKQSGDLEKKVFHLFSRDACKAFNFVSSRRKEGVTTVLANLVQYVREQRSGKKLLVIDANFVAPRLHHVFGLKPDTGLAEVLAGNATLNEALVILPEANMALLQSGKTYRSMTGDISLERFQAVITEAKDKFDYIFVDSPPLLASSSAVSTAVSSDATFLILQALKVQREVAMRSKNLLVENNCMIGGVVLNRVPQVIPSWVYRII